MPLSVALSDDVVLRDVTIDDAAALADAYTRNRAHLEQWEPARPDDFFTEAAQKRVVDLQLEQAGAGRGVFLVLASGDDVVGRLNLADIVRGAFQNGNLGYWIDADLGGRGLMTRAVTSLVEHARDALDLHRLQAGTLPHNKASQAVLTRAGFERFGYAPRYMRIAGEWRDHILYQRILHD
ncbi:GNAT family N-acetyltransferase [Myceligenerans pegani]|uniref:GNAT family N-acetyltransferase n=1 Tax=Myceligenerans pegani TaxID=2776917 RepID=A0ABR9MWQ0_9MICO|nr:GNAT family protein [Myceligenerans sp. TRM 65318]MBE1875421.1 GNAT family N-acetyltransferase [Myceligenerans sp. TRM 65318]MBE3017692.1 GNAT family N-acetyltransferase [Myceligenerans sp. TRM 65318]